MGLQITPLEAPLFESLRQVLDAVAREKRYLAFVEAPAPEAAHAFYRNILLNDLCMVVARLDGSVVGWCDVLPTHGQARAHVGTLGIGLLPSARHRGIGRLLMQAAISKAWAQGLLRIELTVRVDNLNAKRLYEQMGFQAEGLLQRAFRVDGEFHDLCAMALLR
jgi:putative acetyltransferase